MKVLMINPLDVFYTPTTGRALLHARALEKHGHEVTMVFFKEPRRNRDKSVRSREEVPFSLVELEPFQPLRNLAKLWRLARDHDVLFLEKAFPYATLPVILAALLSGKPIHYDWTDLESAYLKEVYRHLVWPWLVQLYETLLPRIADSMSVASRDLEQRTQKSGFNLARIGWLPATADTEQFIKNEQARRHVREQHNIPDSAITFMYLGGLEPGTYVDVLVDATAELRKEFSQDRFRLLIVGGGTWQNALEKRASALNVRESIVFAGMVEPSKIVETISAADVGLAPYEDTPYVRGKSPLKLAEYLSCSLPIIGSAVGDVPEMIGSGGLTVDETTPAHFAEAMKMLLDSPDEIGRLAKEARNRSVEFYNHSTVPIQAFEVFINPGALLSS